MPLRKHVDIRNATATEASEIAAFVSAIAIEHIACSLCDGGLNKLLGSMNVDATRQLIAEGWLHMCAFVDGKLAGVVVVKPPIHLYHLFVRSDLHRTGIGKKLLELADDWSVNSNGIRLATVNSSLNAVHVDKRLGFSTHGPVIDIDGVRHQPMVRQKHGLTKGCPPSTHSGGIALSSCPVNPDFKCQEQ